MPTLTTRDRSYEVDPAGFLIDSATWDDGFAAAIAAEHGIPNGLSPEHWQVIRYIRQTFAEEGRCPLVHQTCRANHLRLKQLQGLFPTGYLRGACKLAGLGWIETHPDMPTVDYADWNGKAAGNEAELGERSRMLSEARRKMIAYLQDYYRQNGTIPTVYQACEAFHLEIEDLERLFPEGYHRGAVRAAGLHHSDQ